MQKGEDTAALKFLSLFYEQIVAVHMCICLKEGCERVLVSESVDAHVQEAQHLCGLEHSFLVHGLADLKIITGPSV